MTLRFGRYTIVGKLGEGAMAAVHLARDPVLDRFVAVKVLHRGVGAGKIALQRFFNEARTVARLSSPHVVEVFDFGRQGREYFLVMEYVDGRSLGGLLAPLRAQAGPGPAPDAPVPGSSGRPLPEAVTASLLVQAAEGLEVAARHGVVHRDIKPENLMLNRLGYLKIADFGIAHLQDESLTRTGAVLGSPLYMSPEQVRGAKPITAQSDMFSLGAVFYRCLAGSPPFAASTLKELFRKIAQDDPVPLLTLRPDLDPFLARLAGTLLQKDPARRGDGPGWLRSELRAWLFARGPEESRERVAAFLRDMDRRAELAARGPALDDALPRTVVSTSPLAVAEPEPAYAAGVTAAYARGPDAAPKPAGRGWWLGAGALVLAAVAGAAALFHQLTAPRPGVTAVREAEPAREPEDAALAGTAVGPAFREAKPESAGLEEADPELHSVAGDGAGTFRETLDVFPTRDSLAPGSAGGTVSVDAAGTGTMPARGTMVVQSSPPFAQVFLDGNAAGVAPVRLQDIAPGPHRLLIKSRSGAVLDTVLQVGPGHRVLKVRFAPDIVALESAD